MDVFLAIFYIIAALVILLFMITVHELGHYISAKALKFKVKEFAVGFGKVLWKKTNKKTGEVFSLRMIPLGGFCSFEGDDDLESKTIGKNKDFIRAEEPIHRQTGYNERSESKALSYNEQPPWKRLIVLFSGAFFNFVCAVLFSIGLLMIIGYNQTVSFGHVTADMSPNTQLQNGDIIHAISVNDGEFQEFTLLNSFSAIVNNARPGENGDTLVFRVVDANGATQLRNVELVQAPGENRWIIGIAGGIQNERVPIGFFETLWLSFVFCIDLAVMILTFLWGLLTGAVSLAGVGGPITTVSVMSESIGMNWLNIFILVPMISVNLALFNLLPIPALDGARMVFTGIEWARGKPVNPEIEARIHMIGILCLFAFVLFVDLNFIFNGLQFSIFGKWLL